MHLFNKIKEITQAADSLIDNNVTNQEERGLLKNQFSELWTQFDQFMAGQLTERLQSDNEHGSMLTRNIRPVVTLIAVVSFFVAVFIRLDIEVIKLIKDIAEICVYFYFGSRGVEKVLPIISNYTKSLRRKG